MAGTILAAGSATVAAGFVVGAAVLAGAATTAQRVTSAADAAALAAADVVSGAVPLAADPCAVAERVAAASGAILEWCRLDDGPGVATVQVFAAYAGITAAARSRAGPPEAAAGGG
ncbi:helicase [Microbacterium resistens]|uniref:helicase n=1 Tax=Microbacterium resistens TaxID=156977 RepID=UPI00367004D6